MTFSEAMDELLSGRKVRQCYWEDGTYIMLDSRGDIFDNLGDSRSIDNKTDLMLSWEPYRPKVTVGALLSCGGNKLYRVVLNNSDKLDIVDTSSWKVFISNVYRDKLDDVIRSYSMKVINNDSIV